MNPAASYADCIETLRRLADHDERHYRTCAILGMNESANDYLASSQRIRADIKALERAGRTRLTPMTRKVRS